MVGILGIRFRIFVYFFKIVKVIFKLFVVGILRVVGFFLYLLRFLSVFDYYILFLEIEEEIIKIKEEIGSSGF